MSVECCVISIGALSHNRLWGETAAVRTSHATTTLVADGSRLILVDPSLPVAALVARFNERTGKSLSDVTDVFCTTLRPVHRRSIEALGQAKWWCGELELESYHRHLHGLADSANRLGQEEEGAVRADLDLLHKFRAAPEKFSEQIHFYPLLGPSAGSAGLLLTPPTSTLLIAGDAALTGEHLRRGMVWEGCHDVEAAMESLRDLLEVADAVIPGHDNVVLSPGRWI
jgi:glyoxylase-like metal-dependent hydrolase (beta-lactamase superfamily II)